MGGCQLGKIDIAELRRVDEGIGRTPPAAPPCYVGLDLAWGERARTGVAVLDPSGCLVFSRSVRSDDEIAEVVACHAPGDVVVAIDAPLVVPNDTGRRPCEAMVAARFARHHAGAYPANRSNPAFNPQPRGARIAERLGWSIDPRDRPAPGRSVAVEVYPHPAMVVLFGLESVIRYKAKPGRDLESLRAAYAVLLGHLERVCGPLLRLGDSPRWGQLRSTVSTAGRKSELKRIEDELDAILCAYLAWSWANARDRMLLLGDYASGYIVVPRTQSR